jgi:hypothetical protein
LLLNNEPCRCFLNGTDYDFSQQGFNCTNVTYQGDKPVPSAQFYFEYVPLIICNARSFPHLLLIITGVVTRATRQVPLVEQELPIISEHMRSPPVFSGIGAAWSFYFCVMFCRTLFVLWYFFFWPLYCLFFYLRLLITTLVYWNPSSLYILFVECLFSWCSSRQSNQEIKCTKKGINNKRIHCIKTTNSNVYQHLSFCQSMNIDPTQK